MTYFQLSGDAGTVMLTLLFVLQGISNDKHTSFSNFLNIFKRV